MGAPFSASEVPSQAAGATLVRRVRAAVVSESVWVWVVWLAAMLASTPTAVPAQRRRSQDTTVVSMAVWPSSSRADGRVSLSVYVWIWLAALRLAGGWMVA